MAEIKAAFGVDIGGTAIKLGLLTPEGAMVKKWEIPTRTEDNGAAILPDIAEEIKKSRKEQNLSEEEVLGIGLGVPGPVKEDGTVIKCVNLGWGVFNVQEELSRLTGLKVLAGNDANMAALGEMWLGGGKGYNDLMLVTLGTGIGGGVVLGGKMLFGSNGAAGEIGHTPVRAFDEEEEFCGCGKRGCLEQYCSARGFAKLFENIAKANPQINTGLDIWEHPDAKEILDAARAGDEAALICLDIFGEMMGRALAAFAGVINPEVFVIGGGMSRAGEILLEKIRPAFGKYAFHACRNAEITLAQLGNDAGIYGGVYLLKSQI